MPLRLQLISFSTKPTREGFWIQHITAKYLVSLQIHNSVDMDLLSLLIKRKMANSPELNFKVIVMSATLDTDLYGNYFKQISTNNQAPSRAIHVGVKRFPVRKVYLNDFVQEEILKNLFIHPFWSHHVISTNIENDLLMDGSLLLTGSSLSAQVFERIKSFYAITGPLTNPAIKNSRMTPKSQSVTPTIPAGDYPLAVSLALHLSTLSKSVEADGSDPEPGDCILVFLPGESEILTWMETLERYLNLFPLTMKERVSVFVLHSQTPRDQLDAAFVPVKPNHLKIILSTNIAESSVTIPDITYVLDHGLRRALEYNDAMGCQVSNTFILLGS
jgi:HrpA-like RNA helicase